ncbi:hypothetical protein [Microbulbifer discodermiae]|uniref:hypothetical protein n=1 Tax=Microbulbifer sp. 2201CG32-9 TaxID=3232309 RepID=UPI00345B5F44
MLGRNTPWRQGSLVPAEYLRKLSILPDEEGDYRGVIVTHDCDLPHEGETEFELIVANVISAIDSQYIQAKHPRKLHLTFRREEGEDLHVSLEHLSRRSVRKDRFIELDYHSEADLDELGKRTLKQWLAGRYGRPALPNALENRLRLRPGKRTVLRCIERILQPVQEYLIGVFLDLGEDGFQELPPEDPYWLKIVLVYSVEDVTAAREAAFTAASQIQQLFDSSFGQPDSDNNDCIVLDSCDALAETHISLSDIRKLVQWGFEHLSLDEEAESDSIPPGTPP